MKQQLTNRLLLGATLAFLAPASRAQAPGVHIHHGSHKGGAPIAVRETALQARAAEAEKAGDLKTAERLLREACASEWTTFDHLPLARFLDRHGREREAMTHYRLGLAYSPNGWSSSQDDPAVLARFGDLCTEFRETADARKAYSLAAATLFGDDVSNPATVPRSERLSSYRSAAHTAAAIHLFFTGERIAAFHELDLAQTADEVDYLPHYYRALFYTGGGRSHDAAGEIALAERLASSGKSLSLVRSMRLRHRIPDVSRKSP